MGRSCRHQDLCGLPVGKMCSAHSWMEVCLKEELPSPVELEESLRNGVLLAKLGHCFAPSVVPLKKIYDVEQLRYQVDTVINPPYHLSLPRCPFSQL